MDPSWELHLALANRPRSRFQPPTSVDPRVRPHFSAEWVSAWKMGHQNATRTGENGVIKLEDWVLPSIICLPNELIWTYMNWSCLALFLTKAVAVPIPTSCRQSRFLIGIMPSYAIICHRGNRRNRYSKKRQEFDFPAAGAERPPFSGEILQVRWMHWKCIEHVQISCGRTTEALAPDLIPPGRHPNNHCVVDLHCRWLQTNQASTGHGHASPIANQETSAAKSRRIINLVGKGKWGENAKPSQ